MRWVLGQHSLRVSAQVSRALALHPFAGRQVVVVSLNNRLAPALGPCLHRQLEAAASERKAKFVSLQRSFKATEEKLALQLEAAQVGARRGVGRAGGGGLQEGDLVAKTCLTHCRADACFV